MNETTTVESLTTFLCDEVYTALGLNISGWYRKVTDLILRPPAARFSQMAAEFDRQVAQFGITHAARSILPSFVRGVTFSGLETIPNKGPLLVVSNHPGTVDGLCITAGLARDDLRIVASGMPFLRSLSSTARHFIYCTLDTYVRMMVIRTGIKHLQKGGSLLIFPSGHLDPDPDILPGAEAGLKDWSSSIDIILNRVPNIQVLVTIVRGVLSDKSWQNPITRLRKTFRDRQRVAEIIQVTRQMVLGIREDLIPNVTFSPPMKIPDLVRDDADTSLVSLLANYALHMMYPQPATLT